MPIPVTTPFTHVVSAPMNVVATGTASAGLTISPLIAQLTALISGAFGLGPLKADLMAQLSAHLSITVAFGDPLAQLKLAIQATADVLAALQASLSLQLPPISAQVSASLDAAAVLEIKLGGINAAIDLALAVKLGAVNFLADLNAALSLGGVSLYYWRDESMAALQAQIASYNFAAQGFAPADLTTGVMLITETPGASASFNFLFALPPLPP